MYSLDLTLPLTGSGNARVRLLADSVNEGNNAATDVVAYSTPTFFIEPIAEQNITLGADWALDVNITGDPDDAYVRGESSRVWLGLFKRSSFYNWDSRDLRFKETFYCIC